MKTNRELQKAFADNNSMIIKERKPLKPQFLKSMNLGSHAMPYKKIFESEKFNQLHQIIYELEHDHDAARRFLHARRFG